MEWLSYRRFGLRILCSLEDYIIQEGTEDESPNALLKTLFYDSLFQSPESSPYRVLVENSGTKCFLSLLHKIIMFSLFFFIPAAMPLCLSLIELHGLLQLSSLLTIHSVLSCCGGQGVQQLPTLSL